MARLSTAESVPPPTACQVPPLYTAMLLAGTPLTELKSPPMKTWLLLTAMAKTIGPVAPLPPAMPDPRDCHVVPFHSEMPLVCTDPVWLNQPPRYSPAGRCASAMPNPRPFSP